ncbi:MAG: cytochrome c oxidase subunit 3 family protein [Gammaproteobacteria bacterium]|nr:MAG: cytochrome c oxidase subunit 3 family protein [Gammaproteobacteria bacterium]
MTTLTATRRLPGDLAIWFFILAELSVFAVLFGVLAWMQGQYPDMFAAGRATLHTGAGWAITAALISASAAVAWGTERAQHTEPRALIPGFLLGLLCGLVYAGLKLWEYASLMDAGFNLRTNWFYTLYYFLTFFHFMHVLMGMIILAYITQKAHRGGYDCGELSGVESGASYWHMVDMVWVVLFPLVYVL